MRNPRADAEAVAQVNLALVRILADMVELAMKRDSDGHAEAVQSAPRARKQNGASS